jgi:AbrB family looped-hinge helix DNA binding protein
MIIVTKLTAKNQTTIPKPVRRRLKVSAGDRVAFVVAGGQVVLRRVSPTDAAFLKLAGDSFADWSDPEAERAFRDF